MQAKLVGREGALFTNRSLARLLIPLLIEQTLAVTIGMADTYMVSSLGEASVSAVSLVDNVNTLMINLFAALATGGAVVASQYIGHREAERARESAGQLIFAALALGLAIMGAMLCLNERILRLVFGAIEPDVMSAAIAYFTLSAISYPFLAVYNAGAALFRAMGNSKVPMYAAVGMNAVNILGNAWTIFGLGWGVTGAAAASLLARALGAVVMSILLTRGRQAIRLSSLKQFRPRAEMLKRILKIGVPNGLENSMFQIGKLLVLNLVSGMGTYVIAANAVSNSLAGLAVLPGCATMLALLTVVGQCMGAGEPAQAEQNTKKLLLWNFAMMTTTNLVLMLSAPVMAEWFHLSGEAAALTIEVLRFYTTCAIFLWSPSFILPCALRGAGDAGFTMLVSVASMWIFRIGFSYLLISGFGMGLMGVWVAMVIDWVARAIVFVVRFLRGGWKLRKVI